MAGVSHIDEIIDYKQKIINTLGSSKAIVGLLLDDPKINMESELAYSVFDNNLFDYDYINSTLVQATALIMVEAEIPKISTATIKDMTLYVQVVVSKDYMKLNSSKFRGVKGNRRDNIVRQIDLLLNNDKSYGIGGIKLERVVVSGVPEGNSASMLTYSVVEFARDRRLGNG
ncbi:MAG: hypothetical protein RR365_06175 [Bacteroides sp.]